MTLEYVGLLVMAVCAASGCCICACAVWFCIDYHKTKATKHTPCRYGPLETLTDYWPVNGVHPVGHRCIIHKGCVANVRIPQ